MVIIVAVVVPQNTTIVQPTDGRIDVCQAVLQDVPVSVAPHFLSQKSALASLFERTHNQRLRSGCALFRHTRHYTAAMASDAISEFLDCSPRLQARGTFTSSPGDPMAGLWAGKG